jgi:hypothetical protein
MMRDGELRGEAVAQVRAWAEAELPRMLGREPTPREMQEWILSLLRDPRPIGAEPASPRPRKLGGRIRLPIFPPALAPVLGSDALIFEHGWVVSGASSIAIDTALASYYASDGTAVPGASPARYEHLFGQATLGPEFCAAGRAARWLDGPPEIDEDLAHASAWGASSADPPDTGGTGFATGLTKLMDQGLRMARRRWSNVVPEAWVDQDSGTVDLTCIGVQRTPDGGYWVLNASPNAPLYGQPLVCRTELACVQQYLAAAEWSDPGALLAEAGVLGYAERELDDNGDPVDSTIIATAAQMSPAYNSGGYGYTPLDSGYRGWNWRWQRGDDIAGAGRVGVRWSEADNVWYSLQAELILSWSGDAWIASVSTPGTANFGQTTEAFVRIPDPDDRGYTIPLWPRGEARSDLTVIACHSTPGGLVWSQIGSHQPGQSFSEPVPSYPCICGTGSWSGFGGTWATAGSATVGFTGAQSATIDDPLMTADGRVERSASVSAAGTFTALSYGGRRDEGPPWFGQFGGSCDQWTRTCAGGCLVAWDWGSNSAPWVVGDYTYGESETVREEWNASAGRGGRALVLLPDDPGAVAIFGQYFGGGAWTRRVYAKTPENAPRFLVHVSDRENDDDLSVCPDSHANKWNVRCAKSAEDEALQYVWFSSGYGAEVSNYQTGYQGRAFTAGDDSGRAGASTAATARSAPSPAPTCRWRPGHLYALARLVRLQRRLAPGPERQREYRCGGDHLRQHQPGRRGGLLLALLTARLLFGKADLTMALNGALAGLVSITAGPLTPTPLTATLIGGIGGVLVVFSIIAIDKLRIDDPSAPSRCTASPASGA